MGKEWEGKGRMSAEPGQVRSEILGRSISTSDNIYG
jgi:hypothetical protein